MQTASDDTMREKNITFLAILTQIIATVLCCILAMTITGYITFGIFIGIITWSLILFTTPVWGWFFIQIKPNRAVLVRNQLMTDKIPELANDRTDVDTFPLPSLREVGPGLKGKLPHEVLFETIDLESEIVIGSKDKPLVCYTSDDVELAVTWQVILTPLRGYLTNFVRLDEDAVVNYFSGKFEQHLLEWVKGRKESEVFDALDHLGEHFKTLFGGPNEIHPDERKRGIFTNNPQIIDLKRSDRYQKAAEGTKVAEKMNEIIKNINAQFKEDTGEDPDPNVVLATAAALTGNDVDGLLIIPGLGKGGDKDTAAMLTAIRDLKRKGKGK